MKMRVAAVSVALWMCACGDLPHDQKPKEPDVPQTLHLNALGLYLTDNPLAAPPGSLVTADNASIWRAGIVEARRGNRPEVVHTSGYADALAVFDGEVLAHTTDNKMVRRTSSVGVVEYSGTYTAPSTGQRLRFMEAQGNLYAGTAEGVKRMTSTDVGWSTAGVPAALEATGSTTGASGFLANNSAVAYRFAWGTRDANGNLHIGAPSGRLLVTNTSGGTRDVALTIPVPSGVSANTYFVQVYRTEARATANGDPGEEMAMVAEVFTTAASGSLSYTDISSVPNGATAYFSPSQGGILNAKDSPPVPRDMAQFKGYSLVAVESGVQRAQLTLLSVDATQGLQLTQGLRIEFSDAQVELYYANATENTGTPDALPGLFDLETALGSAALNIEATARSLIRVINSRSYGRLYAEYASSANDPPGIINIRARNIDEDAYTIQSVGGATTPWSPSLQTRWAGNQSRAGSTVTVQDASTNVPHGFAVGQTVYIDALGLPSFTTGNKVVASVPNAWTFTYTESGAAVGGVGFACVATTLVDPLTSDDGVAGDTWAYSAFEEPEAVPLANYFNVANGSVTLYRVVPQGDAVWFWTSGGLYRLSGTSEADFTLRPFDPTVRVIAPDSVVAMANRIWALTEEGVVSVSDSGVELVSKPVEKALLELRAAFIAAGKSAEYSAMVHAVGYETEKEYRLWLPTSTSDTYATQAFVYNYNTGTWTRHTTAARAGIVSPTEDVQYLSAGATQRFVRERKARNLTDYADADGVGVPFSVTYAANVADNPGGAKQWTEASWLLESPLPSSMGVSLHTEVSSSPESGTLTTNGLPYVSTYVPTDKARSSVLYVGASHSTAGEKASLTGISVTYTTVSTKLR